MNNYIILSNSYEIQLKIDAVAFQIRPSSGKDPSDRIREATTERKAQRDLWFFGVYFLLGQKPQGQLGDQEANSAETAKPLYADVVELVQGKSAHALERAVCNLMQQVARVLPIFWGTE